MKWRCMVLLVLLSVKAGAAVRWTGMSANGLWADPVNWENGILPGPLDDVLLDNSLMAGTYVVKLPDFAVTIRSLLVMPANLQTITVELPNSNLLSSAAGSLLDRAFTTTGNGYSIVLEKGAVFINASGSNSGYSLRINDSLEIKNGGKYIHRSRTGHAEIVQFLGKAAGTEKGIFRFENPDAASTISLSGRVFGSLQLSAIANSTGSVSYSASGTNPVRIRGNLELESGAGLAINFDDTISIAGDLVMSNAVFNLATGNRSAVIALEGNWQQSGGSITETNTQQKTGTMLLGGNTRQTISCSGLLVDSIILGIKNPAGVALLLPLRCSYGLHLIKGALLTTNAQLMTLAANAWIQADTMAIGNFVDGPLKKEGLLNGYFMFPVGRNGHLRWLALKNASGDLQVEYHPESAAVIGTVAGAGLDHISQVEYWSVTNTVASSGQVELSFEHESSGGVSELVSLRVAAFTAGSWTDAGNQATTGAAFANGSVSSLPVIALGSVTRYFTLASSSSFTNVLPVYLTDQWMEHLQTNWYCNWTVANGAGVTAYVIEVSEDGRQFERITTCYPGQEQQNFRQLIPARWAKGICRIVTIHNNGKEEVSAGMRFGAGIYSAAKLNVQHAPGASSVQIFSGKERLVWLHLFDNSGRLVTSKNLWLYSGTTSTNIVNKILPAGIYWIRLSSDGVLLWQQGLVF
jgi:hypothetical protein